MFVVGARVSGGGGGGGGGARSWLPLGYPGSDRCLMWARACQGGGGGCTLLVSLAQRGDLGKISQARRLISGQIRFVVEPTIKTILHITKTTTAIHTRKHRIPSDLRS